MNARLKGVGRAPLSPVLPAVAIAIVVLSASGCEQARQREDWKPEVLARTSVSRDATVLRLGHDAYATYCVGCHGENGNGKGPAARFLAVPPRDFTLGIIKFAAVEAGELPHDADYERVIRRGLPGSSMPAWRFMPQDTLTAIVQYLKTFATDAFAQDEPHVTIVPSLDPWSADERDEAVAEGEAIYHAIARCNSCHPSYATRADLYELSKKTLGYGMTEFREAMYEPVMTETDWGHEVEAPDFLTRKLRNGTAEADLYRVIVSGVGGTAMPTWRGALPDEKLWALVHYIKHLAEMKGTPAAAELRRRLADQPPFTPPSKAQGEES